MPFDPVRDAVQTNSPITTSQPPFPPFYSPRNDSPTNSFNSVSLPHVNPTIGRRATDLSVLLNAEPEEPQTPIRSSSLSHLLLPESVEDDQLAHLGSIRRNYRPTEHVHEDSYAISSRPPSSHSKPVNQSAQSFDALRPITPPSRSPVVSHSRPSSSSSSSRPTSSSVTITPRTTTSPVVLPQQVAMPSKIPYRPHKRMTPADSVLRPMTPEEIESYRATYSIGARRLKKRKRGRSDDEDEDRRPNKKLAGDVGVVVEHCESQYDSPRNYTDLCMYVLRQCSTRRGSQTTTGFSHNRSQKFQQLGQVHSHYPICPSCPRGKSHEQRPKRHRRKSA